VTPYNNFTSQQRTRALRWLNAEYAAGRRHRPTRCDVCHQTEGPIERHSEDYSFPFGDHIGQYGLCYRCHLMIHCRFKNPEAWENYKRHMHQGRIFVPIGRNFWLFWRQTLKQHGEGVPFRQGSPRAHTLLDDLSVIPSNAHRAFQQV
jgi:hypothetical protein